MSRYARYLPDKKRRETWEECVDRYISFMKQQYKGKQVPWKELREAVLNLEVMPSMRAMMTAGEALERDNVAGYNCAYTAVDNIRVFDEILYILMCGTGVGYSVERQNINQLPEVAEEFHETETTIVVRDSKIGWAKAYRELVSLLYQGQVPRWDLSRLRPAGAVLRTFGGRSSGPEPLNQLFEFTVRVFRSAAGRKLNSLEVHDVVCKVAETIVCGGVRRSALISLSNLSDPRLRDAKSGEWYFAEPQRQLANNSVAYTERPDIGIFMQEWQSLYSSKAGERGIFNRQAVQSTLPERRDPDHEFGTNPCSEIILRSGQFCNLTEVVVRENDTESELLDKIEMATILGTLQAGLTDFRYLRKKWQNNCEEEALLGVSLTGIMDNHFLATQYYETPELLHELKKQAIETNKKYAKKLGLNPAAAITCVKPSGTVSQLVNSSSGIHPRYSLYYIRRVRSDANDPLATHLRELGVPCEPALNSSNELVFSFPIASPEGAKLREDMGAIQQLEHWLMFDEEYCEHKPSVSIYVREDEWLEVGAWVYKHFDRMSGVSFFPYDDHVYPQAPYEPITKEEYEKMVQEMPDMDLSLWQFDEWEDNTTASQELACSGGACEL
jgi:ribonucleoside-diphosphate reductase alpha chain